MCRFRPVILAVLGSFTVVAPLHLSPPLASRPGGWITQAQATARAPIAQDHKKAETLTPTQNLGRGIHFRDIAAQAGLATIPHSRSDRRYVLDTMAGGGIALFDCDNDGKLDIIVVNDSAIDQYLNG